MARQLVFLIIFMSGLWLIFDQINGKKRLGTFIEKLVSA